ncbi:MAG: hypothetical protein U0736_14035 [Gemmataceae bacterium]
MLFYYRHLLTGFSRTTSALANHRRVLRQFTQSPTAPASEPQVWELLAGMGRRIEELEARQAALRYRLIDRVYGVAPPALRGVKRVLLGCRHAWDGLRGLVRSKGRRRCSPISSGCGAAAISGCRS